HVPSLGKRKAARSSWNIRFVDLKGTTHKGFWILEVACKGLGFLVVNVINKELRKLKVFTDLVSIKVTSKPWVFRVFSILISMSTKSLKYLVIKIIDKDNGSLRFEVVVRIVVKAVVELVVVHLLYIVYIVYQIGKIVRTMLSVGMKVLRDLKKMTSLKVKEASQGEN
nr:hypothetical protein [Tanacetum cinerariifolium]